MEGVEIPSPNHFGDLNNLGSLLELFGVVLQVSAVGFLFALPIFIYEMTVAEWLLKKGLIGPVSNKSRSTNVTTSLTSMTSLPSFPTPRYLTALRGV